MAFKRYATMTNEDKDRVVEQYRYAIFMGSDPGHAVACAASSGLGLTNNQWNSGIGADAFAAAMATLVMRKEIKLVDASAKLD